MLPPFLAEGGLMIWVIMATSAVAIAAFLERLLQYHREQINSGEFLNGVRNVLKRENVVEAVAICDATPGPVARLVKLAILNRESGREAVREILEDAGAWEVPRLEQKLSLLATIAQIAPLLGLLGTVMGLMDVFRKIQDAGLNAHVSQLSTGVLQALICTAAGLAVAIASYAGYNYLVGRVHSIVLDMERVSSEILNIVAAAPPAPPPPARPA
jgi:biopolymer transport protein ExbB